MELFVYVTMYMEDDARELPTIIMIGCDDAERVRVRKTWHDFDVAECECFKEEDKTRIMAVIERHPGGVCHFNRHVTAIADLLLGSWRSSNGSDLSMSAQWSGFVDTLNSAAASMAAVPSEQINCGAMARTPLGEVPEPDVIPGCVS